MSISSFKLARQSSKKNFPKDNGSKLTKKKDTEREREDGRKVFLEKK